MKSFLVTDRTNEIIRCLLLDEPKDPQSKLNKKFQELRAIQRRCGGHVNPRFESALDVGTDSYDVGVSLNLLAFQDFAPDSPPVLYLEYRRIHDVPTVHHIVRFALLGRRKRVSAWGIVGNPNVHLIQDLLEKLEA